MRKAYIISDGSDIFCVDAPLIETTGSEITLQPNMYYNLGVVEGIMRIYKGNEIANVANNYIFKFEAGDGLSLALNGWNLKWANGDVPTFTQGDVYEITIIDNCAIYITYTA